MKLRIKICGVTRPEDAELAVSYGTTHIGCILVDTTPRRVSPDQAREVFQAAGKKTTPVLVYKDAPASVVLETAAELKVKDVQVFGVSPADAAMMEEKGLRVWRVHEIPTGSNALPPLRPEPSEKSPAVIDVARTASNITFPWEILGPDSPPGTFISGGVRPENVCALLTHHPYGIDICSGVERSPGIKDEDRIELLFDTLGGVG